MWRGLVVGVFFAFRLAGAERPAARHPDGLEDFSEELGLEDASDADYEDDPVPAETAVPAELLQETALQRGDPVPAEIYDEPYKTPEAFKGLANDGGKWNVFTKETTGQTHDMDKLRAKWGSRGTFPTTAPHVSDTYDGIKKLLIGQEQLLLGKNRGGGDHEQFSVTRVVRTGSDAIQKNSAYKLALKSYVDSLFGMSAGSHDMAEKEFKTHTAIAQNLAEGLSTARGSTDADIEDERRPQGYATRNTSAPSRPEPSPPSSSEPSPPEPSPPEPSPPDDDQGTACGDECQKYCWGAEDKDRAESYGHLKQCNSCLPAGQSVTVNAAVTHWCDKGGCVQGNIEKAQEECATQGVWIAQNQDDCAYVAGCVQRQL